MATTGVGGATCIHHAPSSRHHPGFLFTPPLSRRRRVGIRSSRRIVRGVELLLLRLSSTAAASTICPRLSQRSTRAARMPCLAVRSSALRSPYGPVRAHRISRIIEDVDRPAGADSRLRNCADADLPPPRPRARIVGPGRSHTEWLVWGRASLGDGDGKGEGCETPSSTHHEWTSLHPALPGAFALPGSSTAARVCIHRPASHGQVAAADPGPRDVTWVVETFSGSTSGAGMDDEALWRACMRPNDSLMRTHIPLGRRHEEWPPCRNSFQRHTVAFATARASITTRREQLIAVTKRDLSLEPIYPPVLLPRTLTDDLLAQTDCGHASSALHHFVLQLQPALKELPHPGDSHPERADGPRSARAPGSDGAAQRRSCTRGHPQDPRSADSHVRMRVLAFASSRTRIPNGLSRG
ncbi:hypothetical protein VTO73DRAFT_4603 [Trametes versicolor]